MKRRVCKPIPAGSEEDTETETETESPSPARRVCRITPSNIVEGTRARRPTKLEDIDVERMEMLTLDVPDEEWHAAMLDPFLSSVSVTETASEDSGDVKGLSPAGEGVPALGDDSVELGELPIEVTPARTQRWQIKHW